MHPDLRASLRSLRGSPGFTATAVLTLALGIGANTTMFSVVNTVLLRPLPGYQTEQLVRVLDADRGGALGYLNPDAFTRLRSWSQSFEQIAGMQFCQLNLTGLGEPEQLWGPCATANWFELQRARTLIGRTFLPDEDQHGRSHVVVLDHSYWQSRFGADPKVLGTKITLNKEPWLIIGVMPREFKPLGATASAIYTPFVLSDDASKTSPLVSARLKPGVSIESAQAEMNVLAARLARENPADWKNIKLRLTPALEMLTGPQRPLLLILMGAVSFVLLIACANVANLLLARSNARRHEIEIRIALGATRARIISLVLVEASLLAIMASIASVLIARLGLLALKPLIATLPRADELSIDVRVLACALALGIVSAVLFGVIPALRSSDGAGLRSRATPRIQNSLIAGEVAIAFVLLIGAGLMIRTFAHSRAVNLGYDRRNVLTSFLSLPPAADGGRTAGVNQLSRIRERIAALPNVRSVATASSVPTGGVLITMDVQPDGEATPRSQHSAAVDIVSNEYFRTTGIPLRSGRTFSSVDRDGSSPVVIVSESIANRYFGGQAIGRRLVLPEFKFNVEGGNDVRPEIIGIAGNICVNSVSECEAEHIYLPESQNAIRMTYILVRTAVEPMLLSKSVRHAVYLESPSTPLDDPNTLESRTAYLTDDSRRGMWLLGVFAGLALLLSGLGIHAVAAYLATARQREMGIRMALGAQFQDIAALVFHQTAVPAALGLIAGGVAAAILTRMIQKLLFGVSPLDPLTLAGSATALLAAAAFATAGPAVRAALTDPARVLRRE